MSKIDSTYASITKRRKRVHSRSFVLSFPSVPLTPLTPSCESHGGISLSLSSPSFCSVFPRPPSRLVFRLVGQMQQTRRRWFCSDGRTDAAANQVDCLDRRRWQRWSNPCQIRGRDVDVDPVYTSQFCLL